MIGLSACHSAVLENLHQKCFKIPWSCQFFQELLSQHTVCAAFGWLVLASDKPAGFILARSLISEAEILTLAVDPLCQKQGIGKALVQRLKKEYVGPLYLEVDVDNQAAIHLYQQQGFTIISKRPSYYRHPDGSTTDAFLMRCG